MICTANWVCLFSGMYPGVCYFKNGKFSWRILVSHVKKCIKKYNCKYDQIEIPIIVFENSFPAKNVFK